MIGDRRVKVNPGGWDILVKIAADSIAQELVVVDGRYKDCYDEWRYGQQDFTLVPAPLGGG